MINEPDTNSNADQAEASEQALAELNNNADDKDATFSAIRFFPVSEGKLITLYILSFGFYGVFWFYKNWKLQQPLMDKKIYPVWRSIFSIFFTHSLFKRIDQQAAHLPQQHKFNANALATLFVAAIVLSHVIDRLSMSSEISQILTNNTIIISSLVLFLLSVYPLSRAQATVNRLNNDMLGYLNHKYSVWNYILIVLGAVFWLLLAMGLLAESMGLVLPE